jgi:general secretion pathway protein D
MITRKRRGLHVGFAAALCAIVSSVPASAASRPDATRAARVWISSSAVSARTGTEIRVAVEIERARGVGSVPFALRYDPDVLEFLPSRSQEGSFLRGDGASTSFLAVAGRTRDGVPGVIVGLSRLGGGAGARGKGTLCVLVFRARAPGVSPMIFGPASVLDPSARPLPSSFRGAGITVMASP